MNEAKRAEFYRQVGQIGHDDAAFIVLPYGPDNVLLSNEVTRADAKPIYSTYRWKDIAKAH